jgi:phage shock protein C
MKLTKSKKNKMISGVCGGIAEHFGWDPTVVRIGYVILSICTAAFPDILMYILLYFIMPDAEE